MQRPPHHLHQHTRGHHHVALHATSKAQPTSLQPTPPRTHPAVPHRSRALRDPWLELASAGQFDGQGDHHTPAPYVEKAFRKYLKCGIFAHGFARARCDDCGHDYLVAFSCKGRGVCPSCNTRRMAEAAAHLSDHVFPRLPVRQWVLSVPKRVRYSCSATRARSMRRCASSCAWCSTACRPIAPALQRQTRPACTWARSLSSTALAPA